MAGSLCALLLVMAVGASTAHASSLITCSSLGGDIVQPQWPGFMAGVTGNAHWRSYTDMCRLSILVNEVPRYTFIFIPNGMYAASPAMPVWFNFHGYTNVSAYGHPTSDYIRSLHISAAELMVMLTDPYDMVQREKVMMIFPEGTGSINDQAWNAGACCGQAAELYAATDDVGFVTAIIGHLHDRLPLNVDFRRIYTSGFSNGGMMAHRLGCELSLRITAIAAVGSTIMVDQDLGSNANAILGLTSIPEPYHIPPHASRYSTNRTIDANGTLMVPNHGLLSHFTKVCRTSRPVPVFAIHGTADPIVPYGPSTLFPYDLVLTIWGWRVRNGATAPPVMRTISSGENYTCFDSGDGESNVTLCVVDNGLHQYPGSPPFMREHGPSNLQAQEEIWRFFKDKALPPADPQPSPSSGGSSSAIVAVAILIPLFVLAIVAVLWAHKRRKCCFRTHHRLEDQEDASNADDKHRGSRLTRNSSQDDDDGDDTAAADDANDAATDDRNSLHSLHMEMEELGDPGDDEDYGGTVALETR